MMKWRKYLASHWDRLMPENTRLLVLAGIHGMKDGRLGGREDREDGFVEDSRSQLRVLQRAKAAEIAEKKITMDVEDVGRHDDLGQLGEAVRQFRPTVLVLAFCWSKESQLNDVLRAAGIYTAMTLREERAQITESRLVELDQGQEDVVRKIADQKSRNIFLWGSSGTGKTLMLVEALLMKISQYRREGRRVKVIVSSFLAYSDEDSLMVDFKQRYLTSLVDKENVSFVTTRALCQQVGVEYDLYQPQSTLTSLLHRLADPDCLTLLLLDETPPDARGEQGADWSAFQPCPTVDWMIALRPEGVSWTGHRVTPPADQELVLSHHLLTPHRNCHQISQLARWIKDHYPGYDLSPAEDVEAALLPRGRLPLWIQRSGEESDVAMLQLVKKDYIQAETVTVLHGKNRPSEEARAWCEGQGWGYVDEAMINGSEAQCVVLLGAEFCTETVSRGRNLLVVVTSLGEG